MVIGTPYLDSIFRICPRVVLKIWKGFRMGCNNHILHVNYYLT